MRCIFMFRTIIAMICIVVILTMTGCSFTEEERSKIRDLDFTVADIDDVPKQEKI